jgi:hypothetical protein
MLFTLSPGEAIRIGAVTLTVLAVDGDLIRFGLEAAEGENPDVDDTGQDSDQAARKHRRKGWEWN